MAETFYLSNIVPQNFENNAGFWNRKALLLEMYCWELTERFENVWIISGPLTLPEVGSDGKKTVTYQVIGRDKTQAVQSICDADPYKLMGFKEFILYITSRKVNSARTLPRLEKAICELKELSTEPDAYLLSLYEAKKEELATEPDAYLLSLYEAKKEELATEPDAYLLSLYEVKKELAIEPDAYLLSLYEAKKMELAGAVSQEDKSG
ncbi:Nuclease EXOG, mitochondrial [Acipenser ruthenus]|uniref:Nuclease EXOG, mitochondrial n=1 Tax=Acipenser ruthenus TaxID=7906 RepID=A0A662YVS5_ACIRT|nr:Nuclease EXOG, mitochondrial [Acipenser ruthenus]